MITLSKSDFKIAQECATKLFYKKNKYISSKVDNKYLEMLADGGYMISCLANLIHEGGVDLSDVSNPQDAINKTNELLLQNEVIIFEAAFLNEGLLLRADIVIKKGNTIELIEVKSKSYYPFDNNGKLMSDEKYFNSPKLKPYTEDIAFQYMVIKKKLPSYNIKAYLLMPDKSKSAAQDGLLNLFELSSEKQDGSSFRKVNVKFLGTEADKKGLIQDNILTKIDLTNIIEPLINDIEKKCSIYLKHVTNNTKAKPNLTTKCSKCEYRVEDEQKNGFNECWGQLAFVKPHLLDLGQLGNINKRDHCIDELIQAEKVNIKDLPKDYLFAKVKNSKPSKKNKVVEQQDPETVYNGRPYYQSYIDKEFLLQDIIGDIAQVNYPIHFIDFETSQMAIPFHKGMYPYQNVLFQFSVHSIKSKGALPTHLEWINIEDKYPNIEFAKQLKKAIGDIGTVMTWSSYENTQLKNVAKAIHDFYPNETELAKWLDTLIITNENKEGYSGRLLDMHDLCKKYYFHPLMGGRTSIKVALPAVLNQTKSDIIQNWLQELDLLHTNEKNEIQDPYKKLPPIIINDVDVSVLKDVNTDSDNPQVKDGGAAMQAYQEMVYGQSKNNPRLKEDYKQALLKYCKLDTLAMLIIWQHWQEMIDIKNVISKESLY